MTDRTHRCPLAAALGTLLAASLACSLALPGGQPTPAINLATAAAATIAALTAPAATDEPTAEATTAPITEPVAGPPVEVDMCVLLTAADAESVLGQPVTAPKPGDGVCIYADANSGVEVVSGYARQGDQAIGIMNGRGFQLAAFGLVLDQAAQDELSALDQAADHTPYLEKLAALSQGATGFSAQAPAGVGDAAYWAWKDFGGGVHQGFLIATRGTVIAGVDVVIAGDHAEADILAAVTAVLTQLFDRLPPQFVLAAPVATPTATVTVGPAAEVSPTVVPGGLIAFESTRDGGLSNIWLMNNDGTHPVQLTHNDLAGSFQPAWSPDGTRLAFVGQLTADEASAEIFIINADGTGQVQLTHDATADQGPAWSPDGAQLIFISTRDGNNEIYRTQADGSNPVNLTNSPDDVELHPTYSPDGQWIAFTSAHTGGAYQILKMTADGQNRTALTTTAGIHTQPHWSPDGQHIAFRQKDDSGANIFVITADGANPINLTNNAALNYSPVWSPDGANLVYVVLTGETGDIWRMHADGSGQTQLTRSPALDNFPAWQP